MASDWNQSRLRHLFKSQNRRCYFCGRELLWPDPPPATSNSDATIDHLTPVARGGDHSPYNTVAACRSCNQLKGPLTEEEFWVLRDDSRLRKRCIRTISTLLNERAQARRLQASRGELDTLVPATPRRRARGFGDPEVVARRANAAARLRRNLIKAGLVNVSAAGLDEAAGVRQV